MSEERQLHKGLRMRQSSFQQNKSLIFNRPMPTKALQPKCTCEQRTGRSEWLQRTAVNQSPVHEVPPIVHEVLRSSGQPLDLASRTFFEPRFGLDFSGVRVHTNALAAESARTMMASAYTVGSHIVFTNGDADLRGVTSHPLLAHELTHVAQQGCGAAASASSTLEVDRPDSAAEQEADRATHALTQGNPVRVAGTSMARLNCRESKPPTPVNHGKMSFFMEEDPAKGKEYVRIVFSPDPKGPQTKSINLIQIAKVVFDSGIKWSDQQPKQAALEHFTTGAGFHVDVKPEALPPPRKKTDPNISPAYPPASVKGESKTETDPLSGLTRNVSPALVPQPGHNLPGDVLDASINDSPGGGISSGVWEMETVAHSDDLGINYGAVRWGFRYAGPGMRPLYTEEKSQISAAASNNVKESLILFNKYYMNKHIVQEGDTLKSISIDYYGDDSQVASIFAINKQALTDANPEAQIPVGTELEMTGRKWDQLKSTPKQNIWDRAK
jgi:nucleoid-associated protein YgaU